MQNTVVIPKFLREVHGEKSNWIDILSTHALAIMAVITILWSASDLAMAPWKVWVLGFLAYDLGGGVLGNFTYSTKWYYDQSNRRRIGFLALHFLQPMLMILIFEADQVIAGFAAYTVAASFLTNSISVPQRQLAAGAFLSLAGIMVLHALALDIDQTIRLLITLFLLKLPLSFSIRWYRLEKF